MTNKHTTGPWDLSRYHFPYRHIVQRTGNADNDAFPANRLICTVEGDTDTVERKANARIIAAAPDMLDALRAIVADPHINGTIGEPSAWYHKALSAIAKATTF